MGTETSTVDDDSRPTNEILAEKSSSTGVRQFDPTTNLPATGGGDDDACFTPSDVAGDGPAFGRAHGPTLRGAQGTCAAWGSFLVFGQHQLLAGPAQTGSV